MKVIVQIPQEFINSVKANKILKEIPWECKEAAVKNLFIAYINHSTGPRDYMHEGFSTWMESNSGEVEDILYESSLI